MQFTTRNNNYQLKTADHIHEINDFIAHSIQGTQNIGRPHDKDNMTESEYDKSGISWYF